MTCGVQGLTWHAVGVMVVFFAIYGISFSAKKEGLNFLYALPMTLAAAIRSSVVADGRDIAGMVSDAACTMLRLRGESGPASISDRARGPGREA